MARNNTKEKNMQEQEERVMEITPQLIVWTEEGQTVEGILTGSVTVNAEWDLKHYYLFNPGQGLLAVQGNYQIRLALENVPCGAKVRITFMGQGKTANGFRVNQFKIFLVGEAAETASKAISQRFALPTPGSTPLSLGEGATK